VGDPAELVEDRQVRLGHGGRDPAGGEGGHDEHGGGADPHTAATHPRVASRCLLDVVVDLVDPGGEHAGELVVTGVTAGSEVVEQLVVVADVADRRGCHRSP